MEDYVYENSIYGRPLTMTGDRQPTPQEVQGAYNKKFGGDLIFDELKNNESYLKDLKIDYKRREGKDFKGTSKDLIEEEFEYWNMVDNNLAVGAYQSAAVFSDMSKEEKQRTMRRFDTYERTNMTGEGSRSWLEQLKGVGGALITDPSNVAGGLGIWKFLGKTALKGVTRTLLQKVMFPAAVGAAYGTAADVERQSRDISLEARKEIDPTQTATTAAVSSALSIAGPPIVKGATGLTTGVFKLITSPEARQTIKDRALKRTVDTFGGSGAAKKEAITQTEETLGSGDFNVGIFGANTVLGEAVGKIRSNFIRKYKELGELGITTGELNGFAKALIDDGVNIPNIKPILQDVERGLKSPSDALRLFRQYIGDTRFKASQGKGPMADQTELMQRWDLAVTDLFDTAANRAGKGKQAAKIDTEFSKWQTFRGEASKTLRSAKAETKMANQIKAVFADPSKSLGELRKLNTEIEKISKFSGVEGLGKEMKGFVQQAMKENFFEGGGTKIVKFAKSKTGRQTLKELFPDHKDVLDDFGDLLNKVEGHGSVPLFWGRLIPMMMAGGAGAGVGAAMGATAAGIMGAVSLGMMQQALSSKAFRKMELKAYSGKNIDIKSVNGMIKWLNAKGFNGEQLRGQFLGTASGVSSGNIAQEVSPEGGVPLVGGAVDTVKGYLNQ